MLVFGIVSQTDTLFYSVSGQFFHKFWLFVGRHCFDFFLLFSKFLSLLDFMVQFALDFGDSSAFYFLIKHHGSVFACLSQSAFCLFGVDFFQLLLLHFDNIGFVFHAELGKDFVSFCLQLTGWLWGKEVNFDNLPLFFAQV